MCQFPMLYRLSKFTFGPCRARMSNPPTVQWRGGGVGTTPLAIGP